MDKKQIMILGASVLQLPGIQKAKELGYHVVVLDMDENAIGFQFADESFQISTIDTDRIVEIAVDKRIDGIMTLATDLPIRAVAAVSEKLELVGVSSDTASIATNKYMMREKLSNHHIPGPEFYKSDNLQDYQEIADRFNYDFIIKPVDNSGSRGVYYVRSRSESEQAYHYAMSNSRKGEVVIEKYMNGPEVSVEAVTYKGKTHICAITDKITTGPPHFVELGHSQPTTQSKEISNAIEQITKNAIMAIGLKNGPSHTEIKLTDNGPKVVEIGARLGGDFIASDLVPISVGIDMVESSIRIAMNECPDLEKKYQKASAIRYLHTKKGRIRFISGEDEARSVKGVENVTLLRKVGENIVDLYNSLDRIGYIISSGDSVSEALGACDKAEDLIKIHIQ